MQTFPHTIKKLELLRRYLERWFAIIFSHADEGYYLDGFSGSGRYEDGTEGSPIVALKVAVACKNASRKIIHFYFADENPEQRRKLAEAIQNLSLPQNFKVEIIPGTFSEAMEIMLARLESPTLRWLPTFAFIDPTDMKT